MFSSTESTEPSQNGNNDPITNLRVLFYQILEQEGPPEDFKSKQLIKENNYSIKEFFLNKKLEHLKSK
jgi:hypothetical protein